MKFGDVLLNFCEWIWRFMILNFLWVIFMVAGGVVLGDNAFYSRQRFTYLENGFRGILICLYLKHLKIFIKKEFINSNKCGSVFFALFAFLAFDLTILYKMEAMYSTVLYIIVMTVLFFVSISFMFFFPLYVYFEQSNKEYIKNFIYNSIIESISNFITY